MSNSSLAQQHYYSSNDNTHFSFDIERAPCCKLASFSALQLEASKSHLETANCQERQKGPVEPNLRLQTEESGDKISSSVYLIRHEALLPPIPLLYKENRMSSEKAKLLA